MTSPYLLATILGIAGALLVGFGLGFALRRPRAQPGATLAMAAAAEKARLAEVELSRLRARVAELEGGAGEKARQADAELQALRARVAELETEDATLKVKVAAYETSATTARADEPRRAPEGNAADVRAELAALAAQYAALETERGELFLEVGAANKARAQAESQLATVEAERSALAQQLSQIEGALSAGLEAAARANTENAALSTRLIELEKKLEAASAAPASESDPGAAAKKRAAKPAGEGAKAAKKK
jgi:chromosome segregation ATPase